MEPQTQPLVCPSHTTQYIGAVIVGILVGAGASFVYFKQAPVSDTNNSYQAGYDAAKKRVLDSSIGAMLHTPDDIRTLPGVVTAVSGNRITINTKPMNPFDDPALDERIVVVTTDTKIFKLSQKDPKVFQAEMDAFTKKMQGGKVSPQGLIPPDMFIKAQVSVTDITVGNTVSVTAKQNIKSVKEFSASEVQIQQESIIK